MAGPLKKLFFAASLTNVHSGSEHRGRSPEENDKDHAGDNSGLVESGRRWSQQSKQEYIVVETFVLAFKGTVTTKLTFDQKK